MAKQINLIVLAVLLLACNQPRQIEKNKIVFKSGYSFGLCAGYCGAELTIDKEICFPPSTSSGRILRRDISTYLG